MRRLKAVLGLLFLMITGVFFTPVICHAEGKVNLVPVEGKDVKDGVYPIEVESSSSMFRIVEAQLTVKEGEMTATLTMSGTGYLKVYMGTAKEALAAGEEGAIPYVENEEGAHTYTVPVERLNQEISCAAYSKKKEKWYDRELVFLAETLPEEALLIELPQAEAGTEETKAVSDETAGENPTEAGQGPTAEVNQKPSATNQTNPAASQANPELSPVTLPVEDGEYSMEISFTGGTGRAAVLSPVKVRVEGGKAVAVLEWNSPNYEYMVVNGTTYQPVNTEGNSVFEIPVPALDQEIPVIGYTVAMSQPHEVEYQLTFHQDTLKQEKNSDGLIWVIVLVAAVFVVGVFFYGKKRK